MSDDLIEAEILPPATFRLEDHIERLKDKIDQVLEGITQEKIDASKARDLAITYGVLIDKMQLLEGKPTQILSVEERRDLRELLPALLAEAERRQITVRTDTAPVNGTVHVDVSQKPRDGRRTKRLRKV
jgi:hypothetical protein